MFYPVHRLIRNMRVFSFAVLLFVMLIGGWSGSYALLRAASGGGIYYVAQDGKDTNPGTEARPWRTIQKAAETLLAGDTVYIKAGRYAEQVEPRHSGSADRYITYARYRDDDVFIDGKNITLPEYTGLFYVANQHYLIISGLHLMNSGREGILADQTSHLIITGNYTYNTAFSGVGVWASSNIIIDGNTVERACQGIYQECITVAGTETFEVKNNLVFDCGKEGITLKDGSSQGRAYRNQVHHTQAVGIYVDAWDKHTFDIEVSQNLVHHSVQSTGITVASEVGGLLENVRVYNNVVYSNRYCGFEVSRCCDAPKHPIRDVQVINNTFYNNGLDPWGGGITADNPDAENVIIRNNIISKNLSFQIAVSLDTPPGRVRIDHNLIDGYRGPEGGETYGETYVEGDPLFVNAKAGDFRLQKGSPAIGAGVEVKELTEDFAGNARPQGERTAGYDLGAYEAQ